MVIIYRKLCGFFFMFATGFTSVRLFELQLLIHPMLSTGFGILVFFTNLSLVEFQVRYLALFLLFSIADGLGWFWMISLHRNILLMLAFIMSLYLVFHFSYYKLITFLMMLCVIQLSRLMIVLSIQSLIRHLILGNSQNCFLNSNLIYKILWTGAGSGMLILVLEKPNWFCLISLITLVLLM